MSAQNPYEKRNIYTEDINIVFTGKQRQKSILNETDVCVSKILHSVPKKYVSAVPKYAPQAVGTPEKK